MDTVREENTPLSSPTSSDDMGDSHKFVYPEIIVHEMCSAQQKHADTDVNPTSVPGSAPMSSRTPSAIIATIRRPSQTLALSTAQAVVMQTKNILSIIHTLSERHPTENSPDIILEKQEIVEKFNKRLGDEVLTTVLSALYAKLLVVLGIAFPIAELISPNVRAFFYQGFYLYLYLGSIVFVSYMYTRLIRKKAMCSILHRHGEYRHGSEEKINHHSHPRVIRYGSFYLRLGAVAFGIGSMVYSGLEFGRYFEIRNDKECPSNVLQAITPATRMILTLLQIQFIFLNSQDIEMDRHKIIARFGLMHMIATNVCEWLYVLVEETKHEIIHLSEHRNSTDSSFDAKYCQEGNVMGSLVTNASPFLFPCTIEYSLICAVILFEMWKKMKTNANLKLPNRNVKNKLPATQNHRKMSTLFHFNSHGGAQMHSAHHFTIDCSNSHRGLSGGILIIVLTIISLIMFFVLSNGEGTPKQKESYKAMAELEVNIVELILYLITTIAVIAAMLQMRDLKYDRKVGEKNSGIGLDNTLLVVAQTGVFIYCMFSIISSYFTILQQSPAGLLAEIFSFVQTCLQTLFVLDGWRRRCRNVEQTKRKPGRELITFLIIANMAMWTINALEKNRAEFGTTHLKFYGDWAWTIITHISMPLAIFYRFHSTICLFEIWKSAYKIKSQHKSHIMN